MSATFFVIKSLARLCLKKMDCVTDDFAWLCWKPYTSVPSWALEETIWSPHWRDAYPPTPCLCSAWGGLGDESRIGVWAGI